MFKIDIRRYINDLKDYPIKRALTNEEYEGCTNGIIAVYNWRFTTIWILVILYSATLAISVERNVIILLVGFIEIGIFWLIECHLRSRQYKLMAISIQLGESLSKSRAGLWNAYLFLKTREKMREHFPSFSNFNFFYAMIFLLQIVVALFLFESILL